MKRYQKKAKKQENANKKPKSRMEAKAKAFAEKTGAKLTLGKKLKHSSKKYAEEGRKYRFWSWVLKFLAAVVDCIEKVIVMIIGFLIQHFFIVLLIIVLIIIIVMALDLDSARCICDEVLIYTKDGKPVTQQTHGNVKYSNSTQPSLGRTNFDGMSNYEAAYSFFRDKGFDDLHIVAMLGNLEGECGGLEAKRVQGHYDTPVDQYCEDYTAKADKYVFNGDASAKSSFINDEVGYGLAQWTYFSRKDELIEYAKKTSQSVGSLPMQLEFIWVEFEKGYKDDYLKTDTIDSAINYLVDVFEQPSNPTKAKSERKDFANSKFQPMLSDLQAAYSGRSITTTSQETSAFGMKIVTEAKNHFGKSYEWGATGPDTFDCSGFTQYVMKQVGVSIERTADDQLHEFSSWIKLNNLQPGDIMYFREQGSSVNSTTATHCGIYSGNNKWIHAPETGDVVKEVELSDTRKERFIGAIRHAGADVTGGVESPIALKNIVFYGDSWMDNDTFRNSWKDYNATFKVKGGAGASYFLGTNSAMTLDSEDKIEAVADAQVIFVELGLNEWAFDSDKTGQETDYSKMLDNIRTASPDVPIVVSRPPRVAQHCKNATQLNDRVEAIAEYVKAYCESHDKFTYVDTVSCLVGSDNFLKPDFVDATGDGFHIKHSGDAYPTWIKEIEKALKSAVGDTNGASPSLTSNQTVIDGRTYDIANLPKGYMWHNGKTIEINPNCPVHGKYLNNGGSAYSQGGKVVNGMLPRDFDSAKKGEIQGPWSEGTKTKMNSYGWSDYFGTCWFMDHRNDIKTGEQTWEQWRMSTKWETPYYYQSSKEYGAGKVSLGGINYSNSCHVYMSSYIASALTGKLITWPEMFAALRATGGVGAGNGYFTNAGAYVTFNEIGIAWVGMKKDGTIVNSGTKGAEHFEGLTGSAQEKINAFLDKGGIVGISTNSASEFAVSGHYFVIQAHDGNGKYKVYSTHYVDKDSEWIEWSRLYGTDGSLLRKMHDDSCFFLATLIDTPTSSGGSGKVNLEGIMTMEEAIPSRVTTKSGNPNKIPQYGTDGRVYGDNRDPSTINHISIHYTAGDGTTPRQYLGMLQGAGLGGMAQIYLDGDEALQVIGDEYHCFHSSNSDWDKTSMGIETCSVIKGGKYYFTKATIERLVATTRAMVAYYGITDVRANVKRHYDLAKDKKACPAMWVNCEYGKNEPTVHPAWEAFLYAVETGDIDWSAMAGTYIE